MRITKQVYEGEVEFEIQLEDNETEQDKEEIFQFIASNVKVY